MSTDPTPSQRIIARFGGQTALANLLGRRQSTIEHWASTGRIPAQWHAPLMALARQKGIVLEAKDFVSANSHEIAPAAGKLGVLLVGLGAVAYFVWMRGRPREVITRGAELAAREAEGDAAGGAAGGAAGTGDGAPVAAAPAEDAGSSSSRDDDHGPRDPA